MEHSRKSQKKFLYTLGISIVFLFTLVFTQAKTGNTPLAHADACSDCLSGCDNQYIADSDKGKWGACVLTTCGGLHPVCDQGVAAAHASNPPQINSGGGSGAGGSGSNPGGGGGSASTGAGTGDKSVFDKAKDDPGKSQLKEVVQDALNAVMGIAGIILLIMVVIGGIMYVVSAGNPTAVGLAKKTIIGAIAGLAIIVLSYLTISLITGLFK